MAIKHASATVAATATDLVTAVADRTGHSDAGRTSRTVLVQNNSAVTVYLGGPGVTSTSYGYALAAGAEWAGELQPDDVLFGAVASGTAAVNVLHLGV